MEVVISNGREQDILSIKVKVKVKLGFSAPSAGIAEIEQT